MIFWFSSKTADESTEQSNSIGFIVGLVMNHGFSTWSYLERLAYAEKISHFVRKTAHATEYAILGWFLFEAIARPVNSTHIKRLSYMSLISFIIAALYGASDELHQHFVPGRSPQLGDVMIDGLGALLMITVLFIFYWRKLCTKI